MIDIRVRYKKCQIKELTQRVDSSTEKRSKMVLLSAQLKIYVHINRRLSRNVTKIGICKFLKQYQDMAFQNLTCKRRERANDDRNIR